MKRFAAILMLTSATIFAGSMQAQEAAPKPAMPMQGMSMMMNCPMNLQGTSVAVSDTATGVAVSLTTKPENVAELRRRVERMAAMHTAEASTDAMKQGQMLPGTIKYEPIENGARLTLTPRDPAKLADFRSQVRTHVERMQKGECAMMQDMMQGMMKGMMQPKANAQPEPKKDEVDHNAHHPEGK